MLRGKQQSHFEKTNTTYKSLKGSECHTMLSSHQGQQAASVGKGYLYQAPKTELHP